MTLLKYLLIVIFCQSACFYSIAHAQEISDGQHSVPGNVLIFISFSMPLGSLQQWAAQAQKIHAPLIIRGLINDSFPETQKVVKQMSVSGHAGVVIDPRLFREYHITQVPAVVVRKTENITCFPNQSCWHSENYDVVSGDVGLENALHTIANNGDSTAEIVRQQLIARSAS